MSLVQWCRAISSHLASLCKPSRRPTKTRRRVLQVEGLEGRLTPASYGTDVVAAFYQDLLHRPPDVGAGGFIARIDHGAPPAVIALEIENSPGNEFRTKLVAEYYDRFLHRAAGDGELQGWVNQLAVGASQQQVEAGIIGSTEYFALHGGTNAGFLDAVYKDVLSRPDSEGAFLDQANAGVPRSSIALNVLTSLEGSENQVFADYARYLGRPGQVDVGAYGFAYRLMNGRAHEAVVADIVGSDEYTIVLHHPEGPPVTPGNDGSPDPGTADPGQGAGPFYMPPPDPPPVDTSYTPPYDPGIGGYDPPPDTGGYTGGDNFIDPGSFGGDCGCWW